MPVFESAGCTDFADVCRGEDTFQGLKPYRPIVPKLWPA